MTDDLTITTGRPALSLPADEAVTRSYGFLGMRGSGKSNAAVVMAEEMWKAGYQWVTIDPKGDWYGMRSSSDGKSAGLEVIVFGGAHQDVALSPTAAAGVELADVILGEGLTCILDLSEFTKGEKIEFLAGRGSREGFASRLFRKKKRDEHDPIHIFLEEAHDYVPQRATGEVAKLVDDVSRFQTMGRQRGFGVGVLSQRSARIHKDVLNQIDTLFAFRTVAPLDRKAILEWVQGHGVAKELLDSLPELEDGEAWVWSPEWLKKAERIRFRRRQTYDSGATPVRGAKRKPRVVLAPVDLKALEQRMAASVQKAKEEDPAYLRKEIAVLRKQLSTPATETPEPIVKEVPIEIEVPVTVEVPVFPEELLERLENALAPATGVLAEAKELSLKARMAAERLMDEVEEQRKRMPAESPKRPAPQSTPARPRPAPVPALDGEFRPSSSQQKILDALAWFESVRMHDVARASLAFQAGTTSKSSGFEKNLSTLRTQSLIDYPAGNRVALTDAGRGLAAEPDAPATSQELQASIYSKLSSSQAAIVEVLVTVYPEVISRGYLADLARTTATSSGFEKNLSTLRTLGLLDYPKKGWVAGMAALFLEEQM